MANLLDEASILLTPTAYNNGSMLAVKPTNGDGDFQFSRGSSATRVNAQGLIENVASNLPRIDYTDGCGSFLMEGQSTNLITQSELFSDASWVKTGLTVNSNSAISPDGNSNASKLVEANQSGGKNISGISFSASTTNTFSVYAKASEREWILLYFNGGGNGGYYFDVKNGVIGTGLGSNTGTPLIEDVGNGWYRCSITHLASSSSNIQIYIAQSDNAFSYRGDGTSGVYIYGAQLEQNSYATSYIPTQGGSSTRLQDIATIDLTPFDLTSITETINGVDQTPITVIPSTYTVPYGSIDKIIMI